MISTGIRVREWFSRSPEFAPSGVDASPSGISRNSLVMHLVSVAVVGAVFVYMARGQWFFYDEWDLLVTRDQWQLLAPHNGHLSLGLVLVFTLIKLVVGLHTYVPYLSVTIGLHLMAMHLLWRLMRRIGVHPMVALLLPVVFGVLGAGAQNTLWAFQTGFIAPLVCGLVVLLILERPVVGRRDLIVTTILIFVGIAFSSTALPMTAVILLFLLVRRGWRPAVIVGLVVGVPYLLWRVIFVRGPQPTAAYAAHGLTDYAVNVPAYVSTSFVDSFAATIPFGMLAPALGVVLALWLFVDMRRVTIRQVGVAHFLVFGALVFAVLVAVSRVNLGVADAASGRYVYVYALMLLPAIGLALTALIRRTAIGLVFVSVTLVVLGLYNVVLLSSAAASQAQLEQFTKQSMSAVLAQTKSGEYSESVRPLPVLAPTLTLGDIEDFQRRGEFTVGRYSASAALSTRVNLKLKAETVARSDLPAYCQPESDGSYVLSDHAPHLVAVLGTTSVTANVVVTAGPVASQYNQIVLSPGVHKLVGFDDDTITLSPQGSNGDLCVSGRNVP